MWWSMAAATSGGSSAMNGPWPGPPLMIRGSASRVRAASYPVTSQPSPPLGERDPVHRAAGGERVVDRVPGRRPRSR